MSPGVWPWLGPRPPGHHSLPAGECLQTQSQFHFQYSNHIKCSENNLCFSPPALKLNTFLSKIFLGKQVECPWDQAEVCEAGGSAGGRIQRAGGQTIMSCQHYVEIILFHFRVYLLMWRSILALENVRTLKLHLYRLQGTFLFTFLCQELFKVIPCKICLPWYQSPRKI